MVIKALGWLWYVCNYIVCFLCKMATWLAEKCSILLGDIYIYIYICILVEALRYMPEGRKFVSQWCHWNFSLT